MACLELLEGMRAGERVEFDAELFIGRQPQQDEVPEHCLCLGEQDVSRRHAVIRRRGEREVIVDLGSTNGTFINGSRILPHIEYPLQDGAEILIGLTRMRLLSPGSAAGTVDGGSRQPGVPATSAREGVSGEGASAGLDSHLDTSPRHQRRLVSMQFLDDAPPDPDRSVAIDASQLIMALREPSAPQEAEISQVLKRLQAMAQVSIALGAVTELDELAQRIMALIFDIFPRAERAFILLRDPADGEYTPVAARQRHGSLDRDETVPVSRAILNEVVDQKQSILSLDAQGDERFGARDSIANLSIRSVMSAPLLVEDEVLGIMQVDNCSDAHAFTSEDLQVLTGICAQTAIALKNFQLYANIENLFEGFVKASVHAIEARDPITAGHSFRVAEYTVRLARAVDRDDSQALRVHRFDRDQMQELRYAALLHDFGKVGVPEAVLTKEKKLHSHQMTQLEQRFRYAVACLEREAYRQLVETHATHNLSHESFIAERTRLQQGIAGEVQRLEGFLSLVGAANEPSISGGSHPAGLEEVARYTFVDRDGREHTLLEAFEFSDLTLARGSLTPKEREAIEAHVSHSFAFLRLIPWTRKLAGVPDIAHGHHEKLDGSGYPQGLHAPQISIQTRILTIADIYDALTSGDRPYKSGLSVERALGILEDESREGKIDPELFRLFIASRAFER